MDYQDRRGRFFFMHGKYKVTTEFYCSGVVVVNYNYRITNILENDIVLSGNNFNPNLICKCEREWPISLGWRGIGELLKEVCSLPECPSMEWLSNRTEPEIDWLSEEDAEYLQEIGESLITSCKDLTFQV